MKHANPIRRKLKQIGIALSFSSFGALCMMGNLLFLPVALLRLNRIEVVRNFVRDFIMISWRIFLLLARLYGSIGVNWRCTLPPSGTLIIANHPSLLDVVIFLAHMRRANCVVKESLCKNPFLSAAIAAAGYIPNTGSEAMIDACRSALERGESLIIFPEGTRTANRIAMHKAAFYIAINFAKNMNCVAIKMDPKSLKKGQVWYDTPEVRMKYDLYELCALDLTGFEPDRPNPIRVRKLYEKISNLYEKENL